jgi:hypothetical protein
MCSLTCRETGSRQLTGPGESPARNTKAEQQQEREQEQEEKTEEGGKNKFGKRPALIRDKIRQGRHITSNYDIFSFFIRTSLFS